jgi:hypothetical protein
LCILDLGGQIFDRQVRRSNDSTVAAAAAAACSQ